MTMPSVQQGKLIRRSEIAILLNPTFLSLCFACGVWLLGTAHAANRIVFTEIQEYWHHS